MARRFPPPWSVGELDARFVVKDNAGQKLACVYFEDEPGRAIRQPSISDINCEYQNGFQVGLSVNLSQPRLAPSRRPIPERIGTTTMWFPVSAVMPNPPTR